MEQAAPNVSRADKEYPKGFKLFLLTVAICLTIFLISLDFSIIATAIPAITSEFHSLNDVGWYGSSYLLTTASSQLLIGKFYTIFNIKYVFLIALLVFGIGSAICGAAPNSIALILGRAIAGCGNAGLLSGALLIMAHSVPLARRPLFTSAITGGVYGVAAIAGPPLGGVFTDKISWRWCFYINLPIGAVVLLVVAVFFRTPEVPQRPKPTCFWARIKRFDPIGTVVFMPAIVCILLALQWGGTTYAWKDGKIIALFVLFGLLILAFLAVQHWAQDDATVPPRIFKLRTIWSCALYQFCLGASFFIFIYYLPIWFQAVQGVSAIESGKRTLPMLIGNMVGTTLAGVAVTIIGYYAPFMIAATVLTSIGGGLLTLLNPSASSAVWIGFQVLVGFGIGVGWQQPIVAVQAAVDMEDVPITTAILSFTQTIGGSLFVSVAQTAFSNKLVHDIHATLPDLDPGTILDNGAADLASHVPSKYLTQVLQAYSNGLVQTFVVATVMAALSIVGACFVEWRSIKSSKQGGGEARIEANTVVDEPKRTTIS
ncbi:Major facilitator superfamily domain, general substrate transporter [Cordyceps fumosorosea ARSEF 2679]|uniref:Major facilitator superfamily domain, general substrate transporter n=1 Tax=Cordyceps fumosorosea (strain ARSEF 2679) TaxID=1081104 RepID=A0A167CP45_CORFA|nr:Major facilitator superfamily domain, general substrate transporter [Cordyceps fumosorosea ARSEF 2679]OAA41411.1 Major facilitator superfamily domain, general substrate transporter [Cordyceps fumosorosea ARSEF 2679]